MNHDEQKLRLVLGAGYRAMVLHTLSISDAVMEFKKAVVADPSVMTAAKAELKRSQVNRGGRSLRDACFASGVNAKFLEIAIPEAEANPLPPPPSPATQALTSIQISPTQDSEREHDEDMTSKLKALAGMAKSTVAQVEADAEAALNKLQAAKQKADGGVAKINDVAGEIEQSAASLEDFANQISNGAPPL